MDRKYMQAAETVLNKAQDITREIQKISRSERKGMRILSDELRALRLSSVSFALNYLFACHSIPPVDDLPDALNNKKSLGTLKDIVKYALPISFSVLKTLTNRLVAMLQN